MRNKILVLGFPHSGTTILRTVLGKHSEIFDVPNESLRAPPTKHEKRFTCIKWPHYEDRFFSSAYEDYYKIFIIRNPLYSFSSLARRGMQFGGKHSYDYWKLTAERFLGVQQREDTFCIKYEDIFKNEFQKLKDMFHFLGLCFEEDVCEKEGATTKAAPSPRRHVAFRMWQIKQPFQNLNKPDKIILKTQEKKKIENMEVYKMLYGDINAGNSFPVVRKPPQREREE